MPFENESFDVVWSLGVIEHIGTRTGHCSLDENYQGQRQQFADEIIRVTKKGGRIILACPNKSFPVDIQHGPSDELTALTVAARMRNKIFERTGMNFHPIWGKHHLLSYSEVKELFCKESEVLRIEALPLNNYFAFGKFERGFLHHLASIAKFYVNNLPSFLRPTFLNPYMLVLIEK